jgi:hypothetical protein
MPAPSHPRQSGQSAIVGGRAIRPSRARACLIGLGLLLPGFYVMLFGTQFPLALQVLCSVMGISGALVLFGVVAGWLPAGYLRFDPLGLTVAYRNWSYLLPWDSIVKVGPGGTANMPIVLIWITHPESVRTPSTQARETLLRQIAFTRKCVDADLALTPASYNIELSVLLAAFERYRDQPMARNELNPANPGLPDH